MSDTVIALKEILAAMDIASNIENIDATEDLYANGVVDSLTVIQFVMAIEDHYNVRFESEDINYDNLKCLDSIASYIESIKK